METMSHPPAYADAPPSYDAPSSGSVAPVYYAPGHAQVQPQYVVQATPLHPQPIVQAQVMAAPVYVSAPPSATAGSTMNYHGTSSPAVAAAPLSTARYIPESNCWQLHFHSRNGRMSFMDAEGNTIFCMEPRPSQMIIAFNSCFGKQWGSQEQMYIPLDPNPIDAFISITPEAFLINIRGMPEKKFLHRANPASFSGNVAFTPIDDTYVAVEHEPECCIIL